MSIYYRHSLGDIEKDYRNNGARLDEFTARLNGFCSDSSSEIRNMSIESGASPDGSTAYNTKISLQRGNVLKDYLLDNVPSLEAGRISVTSLGIDWDGFRKTVAASESHPEWRDSVLSIIDNVPEWVSDRNGKIVDGRKARLQRLDGGRAWAWMLDNLFGEVQKATCRALLFREEIVGEENPAQVRRDTVITHVPLEAGVPGTGRRDTLVVVHRDTVYCIGSNVTDRETFIALLTDSVVSRIRSEGIGCDKTGEYERVMQKKASLDSAMRRPVLAFRTNLLLPLLNVGVEIPLGNRFSLGLDCYYPFSPRPLVNKFYPAQSRCFQVMAGYIEGRYWFGSRHRAWSDPKYRLTGHSLALLGGGGYYDLQKSWDGKQGEAFVAGVDYMYALPVGKRSGIHFEFDFAFGFFSTSARLYDVCEEGGKLIRRQGQTYRESWFGPIKAGISLVVPIFRKEESR